jgi:hypothetical protein
MQRLGRNSALSLVESIGGAVNDSVPVPEGVALRSDDEMVIWRQFTSTRAAKDWRDFDLLLVAKAVRAEADIRKHQVILDKAGPLLKTDRGMWIENPLLRYIDTLQRQQLAIIRSLSLNQTEVDPRTMNAGGAKQQEYKNLLGDMDDLIARPS